MSLSAFRNYEIQMMHEYEKLHEIDEIEHLVEKNVDGLNIENYIQFGRKFTDPKLREETLARLQEPFCPFYDITREEQYFKQ